MQRSLRKFYGDRGGAESAHRGRLHWPGTPDGFPFRGEHAPDLRQEEAESLATALDYHSDRFCLWKPEEKQAFDLVMERIANGWYMQHKRFDHFVADQMHYVVFLEWVQIYGEIPDAKHPGSSAHAETRTLDTKQPAGLRLLGG